MNTTDNTNTYLHSILNPYQVKARVPDLDMTSSVIKGVKLVRNLAMGNSGEMLIVYRPHSRSQPISIYGWHTATQRYVWWQNIDYDERIVDNFELARFVSGALKVISATVSGGNFNVSGVISATQYQDLPDIEGLRFETISSYKRDSLNTLSCVVTEGVCSLAHPDGAHAFVPYNTNSVCSQDSVLTITDEINVATDSQLWEDGTDIFNTNRVPGYLPVNLSGLITITGNICIAASSSVALTLIIKGSQISADFQNVLPIFNATDCRYEGNAAGRSMSVYLSSYIPWPIESIAIQSNNAGAILGSSILTIESQNYYQRGFRGPGTLIGMQAVTPGQQIALNAVGNFEVVPNASLSRNLSTSYSHMENPFDMEMAEMYIQRMPMLGEAMLQTIPTYDLLLARKYYQHLSDRGVLGQASSFTDFLRNLWSRARPMLGAMAPIAGAAFGPEGALIGRGIGGLLGSASSVYQKPGQASFIGSDEYNKQVSDISKRIRYVQRVFPNYMDLTNFNLASGANMTNLKLASKAGLVEPSLIGVAIFPYVVNDRVFFGKIYTSSSPIGFGESPNFAVTTYDNLTTLVSSRRTLDNEALCSVLLGVQAAAYSSANFVAVDTDHDIAGGSLGAAAYYSATKVYLGTAVTGSITPEGVYWPDDIELKTDATNRILRRPLLIAGVPADPHYENMAQAMARGKLIGNVVPKMIPLKNPTCGNLYACMFVNKVPGTSIGIKAEQVTIETNQGPAPRMMFQLATAKPSDLQQKAEASFPFTLEYYDIQKDGVVKKVINSPSDLAAVNMYKSIQNSSAYKKGQPPMFKINDTEAAVLKKHFTALKDDPTNTKALKALVGIVRGSLNKNLGIIEAKKRADEKKKRAAVQVKRQNLPLVPQSALIDLSQMGLNQDEEEELEGMYEAEELPAGGTFSVPTQSAIGSLEDVSDIMASLEGFL